MRVLAKWADDDVDVDGVADSAEHNHHTNQQPARERSAMRGASHNTAQHPRYAHVPTTSSTSANDTTLFVDERSAVDSTCSHQRILSSVTAAFYNPALSTSSCCGHAPTTGGPGSCG